MFTQPALGTITIFAGNLVPQNWALCQGQLLSISENVALYSVIGNTYGGDGSQTFALPDLRGRVAISAGQAPGMESYGLGEPGGSESIVFTGSQVDGHSHPVTNIVLNGPPASNAPGTIDTPGGNVPAVVNGSPAAYSTTVGEEGLGVTTVSNNQTGVTGDTDPDPVNVVSPYLALNYIICTTGIFPTKG